VRFLNRSSPAPQCRGDIKPAALKRPAPPRGEFSMAHKNKTNKSVKKRIKVTGTGKLKYAKVGRRHLNAHMTAKRTRQLRTPGIIGDRPRVQKKYKIALGVL
jgi:large subunit ribosomal protein L35